MGRLKKGRGAAFSAAACSATGWRRCCGLHLSTPPFPQPLLLLCKCSWLPLPLKLPGTQVWAASSLGCLEHALRAIPLQVLANMIYQPQHILTVASDSLPRSVIASSKRRGADDAIARPAKTKSRRFPPVLLQLETVSWLIIVTRTNLITVLREPFHTFSGPEPHVP